MTTYLADTAVVITGAFGILGRATASAVANAGGRVALIDRASTPPAALLEACGPDPVVLADVNLSETASATAAIDSAHRRLAGIDVLINIAGAFRWQLICRVTRKPVICSTPSTSKQR